MKHISALCIVSLLAFSACTPETKEGVSPVSSRPENFNELTGPANFNWSTSQNVLVNFSGFASARPNEKTVLILTAEDGGPIYKGSHPSGQAIQLELTLPASNKNIRVQYGVCDKLVAISNASINTTLLPELPEVQ